MQTILNASLVSMLAVLQFTLSQNFGSPNQPSTLASINSASPYFIPTAPGTAQPNAPAATNAPHTPLTLPQSRILAAMPHLVSMVRLHLSSNPLRVPPQTHNPLPIHSSMLTASTSDAFQRRILLTGGVGITASTNDSCIHYYCRIRLRIKIDIGSSRDQLVGVILILYRCYGCSISIALSLL